MVEPLHPRHDRAVVATDHQFQTHRGAPAAPFHDSHHGRCARMQRHAVNDDRGSFGGFIFGFENQRTVAVFTANGPDFAARSEEPSAVVGSSEKCGETSARIEAGDAHPVDGTVARNEGRGIKVANENIIFNARRHESFFESGLNKSHKSFVTYRTYRSDVKRAREPPTD